MNAVFTEGDASTNPLWHPRARTDLSNVNISRAWSKASAKAFNAFSSSLEGNPHGTVHGAVGGEMGFVNSSARDPIFWLHHANIDRLWDVWVRLADGRQNPSATRTWAKQKHSFDTTASKVMATADLLDSRNQLGYIYDDYEIEPITTSVVVASEPIVIAGGQVASPGESGHAMVPDGVEKSDGNKGLKTLSFRRDIALGGRSVVVDLPVAPDAGSALTTFAIEPEKSAIKSAWLVLEDVRIGSDGKLGGFSYDIKLKKKNAGGSQDVVLGTLNTFTLSALKHSPGMAHTGGGHGTSGDAGTLRLPISDALRQLGVTGASGALQALSVEFESSIPESADKQYLNVGNIRIETSTLPIE
ncbi:MAG: tyrosinase family protein [Hyphomicrobiaceae bacterium]|nr:tyrosinase family protein [Hyphomicrobiaceae bacterium]